MLYQQKEVELYLPKCSSALVAAGTWNEGIRAAFLPDVLSEVLLDGNPVFGAPGKERAQPLLHSAAQEVEGLEQGDPDRAEEKPPISMRRINWAEENSIVDLSHTVVLFQC